MVLSNYQLGWKDERERYPGMRLEYIPLDIAWKAARYAGMNERYPHFFAKSGHFAFFLYDLDRFWVYDLLRIYLVDNALSGCNVRRSIFDPPNINDAVAFIKEMVKCGNLIWVSWMEPLLVYGMEDSERGFLIHWHNPAFAPEGTTWGRDELENWWNWADFENARLLIAPTGVEPGVNSEEDIAVELAKLAVRNGNIDNFELGDVNVPFGDSAYSAYAEDLRNPDIDFLKKNDDGKQERIAWFCFAIYSQWTETFAAHTYFSHISSAFPEVEREALRDAADHYGKAYGHWLEWEQIIGRHPDAEIYKARIKDMKTRVAAAEKVEAARKEIANATEALAKFLKIRGIPLEDEKSGMNEKNP